MGIEKRKERRIKVELPIRLIWGKDRQLEARTQNISRLGTYIRAEDKITPGTDVEIALEIPASADNPALGGRLLCKGNIFRVNLLGNAEGKNLYGIGIFFTGFPDVKNKEKLSRYIDFLILAEDRSIKIGAKKWRDKREAAKMTRAARQPETAKPAAEQDTAALLKEILARLDEISRLLKSGR